MNSLIQSVPQGKPFAAQQSTAAHILLALAHSDPKKFSAFFSRVRQAQPEAITRACLRHLAAAGDDEASREMSSWLARDNAYLKLLFDPDFLPIEQARSGLQRMREADQRFLKKLSFALDETNEANSLIRALALIDKSEDSSAFCVRLCRLTWHPDPRIRSKAVLALCRIRPNAPVIERHMESEDARVRANAVEALWHFERRRGVRLLRDALTDSHHRVVVNGILGLYYWQEEGFYSKMLELSRHGRPNFRLALAWALAHVKDKRAVDVLGYLQHDESAQVRSKASASLAVLSASQHNLNPIGPWN